jgi:hypothetical protein
MGSLAGVLAAVELPFKSLAFIIYTAGGGRCLNYLPGGGLSKTNLLLVSLISLMVNASTDDTEFFLF